MLTPEQKARQKIDRMLAQAGWSVLDKSHIDFSRSPGVAVREYPTDSGSADYLLFTDRRPAGVIEAKAAEKGQTLNMVAEQSERYATSQFQWFKDHDPLPFIYESNGEITWFRDTRDPSSSAIARRCSRPRSRGG